MGWLSLPVMLPTYRAVQDLHRYQPCYEARPGHATGAPDGRYLGLAQADTPAGQNVAVAPVAPDQLVKPLADPVRGAPIYPMAPVVHLCGGPLDGQCVTLRSEHRPAPGVFYWIPRAAMHAGEGLALIEQQPGDDAVARLVHHGPGMRHGYVVTHDTCSSGHPVLEYQTTTGEPPAPTA